MLTCRRRSLGIAKSSSFSDTTIDHWLVRDQRAPGDPRHNNEQSNNLKDQSPTYNNPSFDQATWLCLLKQRTSTDCASINLVSLKIRGGECAWGKNLVNNGRHSKNRLINQTPLLPSRIPSPSLVLLLHATARILQISACTSTR